MIILADNLTTYHAICDYDSGRIPGTREKAQRVTGIHYQGLLVCHLRKVSHYQTKLKVIGGRCVNKAMIEERQEQNLLNQILDVFLLLLHN